MVINRIALVAAISIGTLTSACTQMTANPQSDVALASTTPGGATVPSTPAPTPRPTATPAPTPAPTATPSSPSLSISPEVNAGAGLAMNQYQSDLAVSPVNGNHITITAKTGNNETETAIFNSLDGGANWSVTRVPTSGDPDVIYDHGGIAHMTFINKGVPGEKLSYKRSTDGGRTWTPFVNISVGVDHPHLAVDVSSSRKGTIYTAGRRFSNDGIQVARSSDQGVTWSETFIPLGDGLQQGFVYGMTVMADGTLVIPMRTKNTILSNNGYYAGSACDIWVLTSRDGGYTFTKTKVGPMGVNGRPGAGGFTATGNVVAGPLGSGERLYLTYVQPVVNAPAQLKLFTSDDRGLTWTAAKTIAGETSAGWGAGACTAMVNKNGVLGIQYFSISPDGSAFDIFFTYSRDQGATFSAPLKVSQQTSANQNVQVQPRWYGQDQVYSQAAPDGKFLLQWPDGSADTSSLKIYMRKLSVP